MAAFWKPLGWPKQFFSWISGFFVIVLDFSTAGAEFIFGDLAKSPGMEGSIGSFFAFQVLPTIIFFASLTALLYHYKILQRVVSAMSRVMQKLMGTSGAESLSVVANIFVGQTESPLVVKPYIEKMTRSELLTLMSGGMATIAGGVMAAYVQLLGNSYALANQISLEAARHLFAEQLLGASFMAAPGALLMAKILMPEDDPEAVAREAELVVASSHAKGGAATHPAGASASADADAAVDGAAATDGAAGDVPEGDGDAPADRKRRGRRGQDESDSLSYSNVIDAAAGGAADGLKLALNVGAMLLAFISLIALINLLIGTVGGWFGAGDLTFQQILGWVFAPVMAMIGVPWEEAAASGSFVGQKIVVNEFVAFAGFGPEIDTFSPKTAAITSFALTGFANLSSLGILLGGLGGIAPDRRSEIAQLGLKAILAGTLANLMSATIAGIMLG